MHVKYQSPSHVYNIQKLQFSKCRSNMKVKITSWKIDTHGLTLPQGTLMFLFLCFKSHEQFFSYLATATITGDRAANLDLCLALTAFSTRVLLRATPTATQDLPFLRSYPKDPWFSLLNAVLWAGAITSYFKRLRFDTVGLSGTRTHDLPDAKREQYHYACEISTWKS
jgi:hypothetical protein